MNRVHLAPDAHKAITDAIGDIHVRLDHIQGALECIAEVAYQRATPTTQCIYRAVECLSECVGAIIESIVDLQECVRPIEG
jgi:hypothetical protein